jgi:hypothetical protein
MHAPRPPVAQWKMRVHRDRLGYHSFVCLVSFELSRCWRFSRQAKMADDTTKIPSPVTIGHVRIRHRGSSPERHWLVSRVEHRVILVQPVPLVASQSQSASARTTSDQMCWPNERRFRQKKNASLYRVAARFRCSRGLRCQEIRMMADQNEQGCRNCTRRTWFPLSM